MDKFLTKLGISFGTSVVIAENVNLQPLWTALITFAVSLITILTVEGGAWLRSYFIKKRKENEDATKDEEHKEEWYVL